LPKEGITNDMTKWKNEKIDRRDEENKDEHQQIRTDVMLSNRGLLDVKKNLLEVRKNLADHRENTELHSGREKRKAS
jgi:hypothetical protein